MPDPRSINRSMFWRIELRLLSANRGRAFVILVALGAGATVTSALLNLQVDAKRRITTEFRSFGANVIVSPRTDTASGTGAKTLPQSDFDLVPNSPANRIGKSALLFVVADVASQNTASPTPAVVVGSLDGGDAASWLGFSSSRTSADPSQSNSAACRIGSKVASQLPAAVESRISLRSEGREVSCSVSEVFKSGGEQDNQIIVPLDSAQRLAALPGRISLIQVSAPGNPDQVRSFIAALQQRIPDASVSPIRQFTEGEANIYRRISGVLNSTVAVILILTALCVMAAMTNIAMERRNDVALMKAIGGAARRVLRFFLVEATLLGFVGGLIGAALGLLISVWLGKAVFGVAAQPRLIVYPVSVALTVLVAILGSFPLRRLAAIRPASIFRGEQ
ncbi:MAG TPA: FtsX-like permease family protein [Terriglobales bacterium]|nr:FtsX-like permease family protein [Terriglobales bacterium]